MAGMPPWRDQWMRSRDALRKVPLVKATVQRARRLRRPAYMGSIRRTTPLSDIFGYDRGTPVGRYYVERFLDGHRQDIRGRVLEVKDPGYTERFGTGVVRSDVLDINPDNSLATIHGDLSAADGIPSDAFDCFILTNTLQYIFDVPAAIGHAHRILRPGGVLLATLPSISRMDPTSLVPEYWRFTVASATVLFGDAFGPDNVVADPYGNVLVAIAHLMGMAHQEMKQQELETHDPNYPLGIAVRAVKLPSV